MSADSNAAIRGGEYLEGPVRRILDDTGVVWTIREAVGPMYDRRRERSLVFMSDDAMRRVRNYPPDWHSLADNELHALSFAR